MDHKSVPSSILLLYSNTTDKIIYGLSNLLESSKQFSI